MVPAGSASADKPAGVKLPQIYNIQQQPSTYQFTGSSDHPQATEKGKMAINIRAYSRDESGVGGGNAIQQHHAPPGSFSSASSSIFSLVFFFSDRKSRQFPRCHPSRHLYIFLYRNLYIYFEVYISHFGVYLEKEKSCDCVCPADSSVKQLDVQYTFRL